MKIKKINHIIRSNKMILIGIGFCALIWVVESATHVFLFRGGDFIENVFTPEPHELWLRLLVVCCFIIAGIYAQFTITKRRRVEEKLVTYQKRLRSLISELSLTEERERQRLATDLHDSIGQLLFIANLRLDALRQEAFSAGLERALAEVCSLIEQAIRQTRSLTFELSPPILYQIGLEAALESLVERVRQMHGLRIDLTDDEQPKPLTEEVRALLFRAVRELLINIVKHANVRNARVSVAREDGFVRIVIADDGIGFATPDIGFGIDRGDRFGLFNIKERLRLLNGSLEIASSPSRGTQVTLMAPLERKGKVAGGKLT